jgi:hypothetical protein
MPLYNQLFTKKVPFELIDKLIKMLGLTGILDGTEFSKKEVRFSNDFFKRFLNLKPEFGKYYTKNKLNYFFNDNIPWNLARVITVLRHCLRLYDYKILSHERYFNNSKVVTYSIDVSKDALKKSIEHTKCTIIFD